MILYDANTIPSTKWINDPALNPKRYVAASLFAGGGSASLGLKLAGFEVRYANEFVEAARQTYLANATPDVVLDGRDVRLVTPADVLRACRVERGQLDYFDMSPPCRLFSQAAGGRNRGKAGVEVAYDAGTRQRIDDLFVHSARLVRGVQPRVFVAENVAGMTLGVHHGHLLAAIDEFARCGYRVRASVLDASWLGVPQERRRLIMVGVREDLKLDPVFPKPLARQTVVRDVIPHVRQMSSGTYSRGHIRLRPSWLPAPTILAGEHRSSHATMFVSGGGFVEDAHGNFRKLTIPELRAMFGVPSDFRLVGNFAQRWARLGDAHVPLQVYYLASTIAERILSRIDR